MAGKTFFFFFFLLLSNVWKTRQLLDSQIRWTFYILSCILAQIFLYFVSNARVHMVINVINIDFSTIIVMLVYFSYRLALLKQNHTQYSYTTILKIICVWKKWRFKWVSILENKAILFFHEENEPIVDVQAEESWCLFILNSISVTVGVGWRYMFYVDTTSHVSHMCFTLQSWGDPFQVTLMYMYIMCMWSSHGCSKHEVIIRRSYDYHMHIVHHHMGITQVMGWSYVEHVSVTWIAH